MMTDAERRREAAAIGREVADAEREQRRSASSSPEPTLITPEPIIVNLATVQPEDVKWLWPGRVAAGKLTILTGNPGLGKSFITLDIAARLSSGRSWPDGAAGGDPCHVVLLSAEDGLADTVRPRLDALEANVARIHHVAVVRAGERERGIQLADAEMIRAAIDRTQARLVIIDPISAYLGKTDSHRDADVRGLLSPLAKIAEDTGAAIVAIAHLSKSGPRPAIHRSGGSIAFVAAARIVLAVADDPDDKERRFLAPVKSNLTAPPPTLAYSLVEGRLEWEPEPVGDLDVDRLLSGAPDRQEQQTDAERVLGELLADATRWPMDARQAIEAGEANGIPKRTMQWTAKKVGIRIEREGFGRGGRWIWRRPIDAAIDATIPKNESVASIAPMENPAEIDAITHIDATTTSHHARAREAEKEDDGNAFVI
jgi:hypothetical protein